MCFSWFDVLAQWTRNNFLRDLLVPWLKYYCNYVWQSCLVRNINKHKQYQTQCHPVALLIAPLKRLISYIPLWNGSLFHVFCTMEQTLAQVNHGKDWYFFSDWFLSDIIFSQGRLVPNVCLFVDGPRFMRPCYKSHRPLFWRVALGPLGLSVLVLQAGQEGYLDVFLTELEAFKGRVKEYAMTSKLETPKPTELQPPTPRCRLDPKEVLESLPPVGFHGGFCCMVGTSDVKTHT